MRTFLSAVFFLNIICCAYAQSSLNLDSISLVKHFSYELNDAGDKKLSLYKESYFDTAQIMIRQERWHYSYTDTGRATSLHYLLEYNPQTRMGSFFTEHLPHIGKKSDYKKEVSNFKSYDHSEKRLWVKQYDGNQKLLRETESSYDEQGNLIKNYTRDLSYNPPSLQKEEVQRNKAGLMILWESYADDGSGYKKVREMSWDYLNDTVLLRNAGYIYNDWNELINTYNKKSGLLEKSILTYGYRQDDGVVKRNHRSETDYKNGIKTKGADYEYNKKISSHSYTFANNSETETLSAKNSPAVVFSTQKSFDANKRLIGLLKTKNTKPEYKESYEYNENGVLARYTEIEYRSSGAHAERITEFNAKGNPIRKLLKVGDKLTKVDEYVYE